MKPLWQNCHHMVVSTFCVHHLTKRISEILLNVLLLWLHLRVKGLKGNFEVSLLQQFDRNSGQNESGCQQTKIAYFCYEIFRARYFFCNCWKHFAPAIDAYKKRRFLTMACWKKAKVADPFRRKIKELKLSIHFSIVLVEVKFLSQLRFSLTKWW